MGDDGATGKKLQEIVRKGVVGSSMKETGGKN